MKLLTVGQATERLGFSERYVRKLIAEGKLAVRRFGRSVRIPEDELATFIAEHSS